MPSCARRVSLRRRRSAPSSECAARSPPRPTTTLSLQHRSLERHRHPSHITHSVTIRIDEENQQTSIFVISVVVMLLASNVNSFGIADIPVSKNTTAIVLFELFVNRRRPKLTK